MSNQTKTFVVTGGVIYQKEDGYMKAKKRGDKVTLAVGKDGLPLNKGVRGRVEGATTREATRRKKVKSSETKEGKEG